MAISLIIPVYNGARDLAECLAAVQAVAPPQTQVLVVDDASTDDSGRVAQLANAEVLRLSQNSGPAAARNHGARHARGDLLFFVDADVVVHAGALARVQEAFDQAPDLAALFGSYDDQPKAAGLISQYRNLLHHFVHQNGNPDATTFWAGCGAIRKSVFEEIGGFDEKRFAQPSIEDIELGYRLRAAGHRIWLDKALQGTHLKRWTLLSMLCTDIFNRALPWSRLIMETKSLPNDLNLKQSQRASFVVALCACTFLVLSLLRPSWLLAAGAALFGLVALNRPLYVFFWRQRGIGFAIAALALQLLYYLYSGISYGWVWAELRLKSLIRNLAPQRSVSL